MMRREWEQRKWEEETSCPATGTGSLGQGRPQGIATPSFSKPQTKGPTDPTNNSLEGERGAAELGGSSRRRLVSRKRVGESAAGQEAPTGGQGVGGTGTLSPTKPADIPPPG